MEGSAGHANTPGVDFLAVDMPNGNRLTVGIMVLVIEQAREAISAAQPRPDGAAPRASKCATASAQSLWFAANWKRRECSGRLSQSPKLAILQILKCVGLGVTPD